MNYKSCLVYHNFFSGNQRLNRKNELISANYFSFLSKGNSENISVIDSTKPQSYNALLFYKLYLKRFVLFHIFSSVYFLLFSISQSSDYNLNFNTCTHLFSTRFSNMYYIAYLFYKLNLLRSTISGEKRLKILRHTRFSQ